MKRHLILGAVLLVLGASFVVGLAVDLQAPLLRIAIATVLVAVGARLVVHAVAVSRR
jgi:hypothetical protein